MTTINPASAWLEMSRELRRLARRASFHIRAWAIGFELRHGLPVF